MNKIDIRNNTAHLIGGAGGLTLIPGRNIGVSEEKFKAAFYNKDGKPTKSSAHLFTAPHGSLPALQVLSPANLQELSPEDAASIISEVNDRKLLAERLKEEKRPAVQEMIKAQLEKLSKSVEDVSKSDKPAEAQPSLLDNQGGKKK